MNELAGLPDIARTLKPSTVVLLYDLVLRDRQGLLVRNRPSRRLAVDTGLSRATIQGGLDELADRGIIEIRSNQCGGADEYLLTFLAAATDLERASTESASQPSETKTDPNLGLTSKPQGLTSLPQNYGLKSRPVLAKPTPNAAPPPPPYREHARGLTHSLPNPPLKEKPKPDRVSECRAEIAARFNAVFPWQIPAADYVFREFESIGADLGMQPDDWHRWFVAKLREKQAKRYTVESPGAVLQFARTDTAPWWYQQHKKPPRRAEGRASEAAPPKTAAELRFDIENLEAVLERDPIDADYYRERLREAHAELRAAGSGRREASA